MTIKELYKWAKLNKVENYDIKITLAEDDCGDIYHLLSEKDLEIDNLMHSILI